MTPSDRTSLGGSNAAFPPTRWSLLRQARGRGSPAGRRALDELCRLYWKPVYAYLRATRAMTNEDAKDLTQEFLLALLEGDFFDRVPEEIAFRRYLRGALRLFLLEERRRGRARKRGGGLTHVRLDAGEVSLIEKISIAPAASPEEAFDLEWARTLLDQAVLDLRAELAAEGKDIAYRAFERYDLKPPSREVTYADVARELGIRETDVANHLHACRRRLRELVERRVRDTVAGDVDVPAEISELFPRA